MLDERFDEVMDIAVRDVEVRLDLPAGFEIVRTSAEGMSANRDEIPPQHLAPNDSMVFTMVIRTCDPAGVTDDTPLSVGVFYEDDASFSGGQVEVARTFGELLGGNVRQLRRGMAISAYADALTDRGADAIGEAYLRLAEADALYPADAELAEIRTVLDAL
jgi:Ca-activated chloride channel family protein